MEPATILVLVLTAGVGALLVWFEINSRRNEARMKQGPNLAQSASGARKETESNAQSETENRKAA
jgi:hypothetical protein